MNSNKTTARIAGFIYLCVVVCGTLYLEYIPSTFKTGGDLPALVQHIEASETLFRIGILSELICGVFFLILPVVLYKLLRPVHETWAKLMVIFAVVTVPISYINLLNKFAVLSLISGFNHLKVAANDQLQAQVAFYLDLYNQGNLVNQIFWGLWLFPFGYLVFKSKFLPKILGILLMAGCFGYLIDFFGSFFSPHYNESAISSYITLPASLGEIGSCLWLLIAGVKNKKA
jgi:hypothetical protein